MEKPAGIFPEQKYGGIRGPLVSSQVEIPKNRLRSAGSFERQPSCGFHEIRHGCIIHIPKRRSVTQAAIKRPESEIAAIFQATDETGINFANQTRRI